MNIIERLKAKFAARHQSVAATYWQGIARLAEGRLSERAAEAIVESLDAAVATLGKAVDDVQADIDAVTNLRKVEVLVQRREADRANLKGVLREGVAIERRAAELEAQAQELRRQQVARVEAARAALAQTEGVEARHDSLRQRLAAGGHPDFVGESDRRERQRQIEHAEGELRSLVDTLRDATAAVESLPEVETNPVAADQAARVRGRLKLLEERRDRLARRLDGLRAGAPLDGDSDDGIDTTDDAEAVEAVQP